MAAVLANGGGFYHPVAYVAEALRMGLTVFPPDVNASDFRCTGRGTELRIGLQFVKGLSAEGAQRILDGRGAGAPRRRAPYRSLFDLQHRTGLAADDLRALIKVGALDSIADGWTRPMMLWMVDTGWRSVGTAERRSDKSSEKAGARERTAVPPYRRTADSRAPAPSWFDHLPPAVPVLRDYAPERRRREEYAALGFVTDTHPMRLHADALAGFRLCRSTELHRHVGRHVLLAGMLTTAKPVHTLQDEPMEFATFDDGDGLIETVLFPQVYRERGHVLFDQGPFIFRGKVEEEFGAVTVTITHLDRLERAAARRPAPSPPR
jgi:DNA polymerase III alpha subunit